MNRRFDGDGGQTLGLYIVAVAALFFLAFAYFAVGQAASVRNTAQTAADASALAAAREVRDSVREPFLDALEAGDLDRLRELLVLNGMTPDDACGAAANYAGQNSAVVDACNVGGPGRATVALHTSGTVGESVVPGTESMHARATATAVVESRCVVDDKDGDEIAFICDGDEVSVDPTADDFDLNLAEFYSVHLSE
ncbi:pilus assembly protein TadG-related protein [Streptomyces sp. NPDC026673]|uniref:pilus assembly protein TadG-related protein n=1 Tax=Streptomyces sp. NPDC026673 TaxID=3155724 RepID=UPI0033FCE47D